MKCLLCGKEAIAIFDMPKGCIVYPLEIKQALCPQHIMRSTPLGGMTLIEDFRIDKSFPIPELGLPAIP